MKSRRIVPIVLAAQLAVLAIVFRAAGGAAHIPAVELISAAESSGSMVEYHFRITNWDEFPAEEQRLWLEVYRMDGARASSRPVTGKVQESFSILDFDGHKPRIYVVLTDTRSGVSWKSRLIATERGRPGGLHHTTAHAAIASQPKLKIAPVEKKDTGEIPLVLQLKERRTHTKVVNGKEYRYIDYVLTVANAHTLPIDWWSKPLTVIPPEGCWNGPESNARVFAEIFWGPAEKADRKQACMPIRSPKELLAVEISIPEGKGIAESIRVTLRDRLTNIRHTSNVLSVSGSEVDAALLDVGCKRFLGRPGDFLCTTATGMAACKNLQTQGKPIRCRRTGD